MADLRLRLPHRDFVVDHELLFVVRAVVDRVLERLARFREPAELRQGAAEGEVRVREMRRAVQARLRRVEPARRILREIGVRVGEDGEAHRHEAARLIADDLAHLLERGDAFGMRVVEQRRRPEVVPIERIVGIRFRRGADDLEIARRLLPRRDDLFEIAVMDDRERRVFREDAVR